MAIVPLCDITHDAVEHLLDLAFGPDRFGRTAYRVRTGMPPLWPLCFADVDEAGSLRGTIQCWPVALHSDDGHEQALIMVGPVAVHPDVQKMGIGSRLMDAMLAAARDQGDMVAMMMIGDAEYYQRWGFTADETGGWTLPGPFEQGRLLLRRGKSTPLAHLGHVGPRVRATLS